MRICIATTASAWGGMEVHTVGLVRALLSKGHHVTVIEFCSNFYVHSRFDQGANVKIVHADVGRPLREIGLLQSLSVFANNKADLCIFAKGSFPQGNWRFGLAARLVYSRFIIIEHLVCEPMPQKSSRRYLGGLVRGLGLWWYTESISRRLRHIGPTGIICVSDAVRNGLTEHYAFPESKTITIHNGIDSKKFIHSPVSRQEIRNEWGISQNSLVFGVIGRFHPVKRFDLVLMLFKKLFLGFKDRDIHLVMIGDGPMFNEIETMVNIDVIKDRVRLLKFTDSPWKAYSAIDVFMMPSLTEGLPLTLLESMSCGCVPIAMGVGGIPEVISEPGLGWLVEPGDEPGFYNAMMEAVAASSADLNGIGSKAREQIVTSFNAEIQFFKIVEYVENKG